MLSSTTFHAQHEAAHQAPASVSRCDASIICPGEELVYEVSWLRIHLGQIRLKTFDSKVVDGGIEHHAAGYIDSYDGLPFVDLHTIDHTRMDSMFYSHGFSALEKKKDMWVTEKSHIDRPHKTLIIEKGSQKDKSSPRTSPSTIDTLKLHDILIQDGLSILYFARANMRKALRDVRVPTVVYGKQGSTRLHFSGDVEYTEIDALEGRKIRVVPLEGKAEFEGIFGFTGDFKGLFTDDDAAIPVTAELKVLIGSVKLELIRWNRSGWSPPE